jgi:hypothetical protein
MAVKYRLFQTMDDKKVAVKSGYDLGGIQIAVKSAEWIWIALALNSFLQP